MAAALREAGTAMARPGVVRRPAPTPTPPRQRVDRPRRRSPVTHLDNEEAISEPLFAEHHDHPAIKEMGKKFGRDQSLRSWPARSSPGCQDGASAEEMAALKGSVPGPVLAIIAGLFGRRYHKEIAPVWATSGSSERRSTSPTLDRVELRHPDS